MRTKETVEVELDEAMDSRHRLFALPCGAPYRKAPFLPRLLHSKKFRMNCRHRIHGNFMPHGQYGKIRLFLAALLFKIQHTNLEEFQKLAHELDDDLLFSVEQETSNNQCLRHSLQ